MKTYNDTFKRTNFNTNTNEYNHHYTTGLKYEYLDFNKITNDNKKNIKEEAVNKMIFYKYFLNIFSKKKFFF